MKKAKYFYDKKTLSFKRIEKTWKTRLKNILVFLSASSFFGLLMVIAAFNFFDSPKEKMLKRELDKLTLEYELMYKDLVQLAAVLENIKDRDDNIYRVIFEADPIPNSIRKAGIGGVNRYKDLEGFDNSDLLISTSKKIDQISKQLYIQSKSFDEVIDMALKKSENAMISNFFRNVLNQIVVFYIAKYIKASFETFFWIWVGINWFFSISYFFIIIYYFKIKLNKSSTVVHP